MCGRVTRSKPRDNEDTRGVMAGASVALSANPEFCSFSDRIRQSRRALISSNVLFEGPSEKISESVLRIVYKDAPVFFFPRFSSNFDNVKPRL